MKSLSLEQFLERVKNHLSVSRFKFNLSFCWGLNEAAKLRKVLADLHSADLRYADLRYANLSSASWCLPCGTKFSEFVLSLKNAKPELIQYLYVQNAAHNDEWKTLLPKIPKGLPKIIRVKKKKGLSK